MPEILLNKESFEQMNAQFEKVFAEATEGSQYATKAERALTHPGVMICDLSTILLKQESEDIKYVMRNIIAAFTETDQELAKKAQEIGAEYVGPGFPNSVPQDPSSDENKPRSETARSIAAELDEKGVKYKELKKHEGKRTQKEIIKEISGRDKTKGSCMSVAFVYAAAKAGYDVKDFRGGDSADYFSKRSTVEKILSYDGIKSQTVSGKNDIKCAHKLMKNMEEGKEYILAIGGHASVIKKVGNDYMYLELQQSNGKWKKLNDDVLKSRFGCSTSRSEAQSNYLMDVDSFANSKDFIDTMGYVNTSTKNQQVGNGGGPK